MKASKPTMKPAAQREAALFQAAAQLTGSARAAFLDNACESDSILRQRLEALLAAQEQTEGPLADAPTTVEATLKVEFTEAPDDAVGQKIDRYRILEKVGEGGCGVVYVAEQTEPVRRRVALKVIKLGMDTRQVVARFEAERQALAMMDHPNIAKVLDAGTTGTGARLSSASAPACPDERISAPAGPRGKEVAAAEDSRAPEIGAGRPYFVMELVRGIRITDYCDQNHLPTRERLDLFIRVCQAIQHAHQKGIIHRDIKPSNILVTLHDGVPVPKVIDFGIAKATEGKLTDATVYTQLHQFIGTRAYMSPEQAEMSGLDIDTRSDIYSLGVLLYELLTGRTPFDANELMSKGIDAMRRTIREKDPVRPSTRLTQELAAVDASPRQPSSGLAIPTAEELSADARRRQRLKEQIARVRGDLDWIVMKCLEKDRTRRYETANGLAVDIKRHLNNGPVVARPPSTFYEFQKTVRRHRVGFAAAAAVLGVLAIGITLTTWQAVRATRATKDALAARQQAEASAQRAVQAQADEARQRQQADAARNQAESLVSFMIQDLQPALKDYGRLSLLRQVDEKTVAYFAALPQALRDAKTELAHADAITALAGIFTAAGDMKAAREQEQRALALYKRLAEQHPEIPEAAAGVLNLEWMLYSLEPAHSSSELDAFQQEILHRWRGLFARFPDNIVVKQGLGSTLWTRTSFAAQRFNKPQEAVQVGLELQEYVRKGMASHPESKLLSRAYANALGILAVAYQAVGERAKAVQASEEAEAFYDQALKTDPGNLSLLADAAEAARNLSYRVSGVSQKRARDAELVARERYRLLTRLDPSNKEWRRSFAMTHMMECYYLESDGQVELARQALRTFDALLQSAQLNPEDRLKLADNSIELARLAAMAGDDADARAQLAAGNSRFRAHYDQLPPAPAEQLLAYIRWWNLPESPVILQMRDWTELERVAGKALSSIEHGLAQQPGDNELVFQRALARFYLGTAQLRQGNAAEAVPQLEAALAGYRGTQPVWSFREHREELVCQTTMTLAEALAQTGARARAIDLMETNLDTLDSASASQPENWEGKKVLVEYLVKLAALVDPAQATEAARRQSLLDRASGILSGFNTAGRANVVDKETLAQIASLRKATGQNETKELHQP
jgi:serine/threonine protein kinase